MKKNKKERILLLLAILFAVVGLYYYNQSKTVVSTGEINYRENSNTTYKVYLKDKKYYNKDYLDEGMQYISSIIDYLDINFLYSANYDVDEIFTINKRVVADLKITDRENKDKIIYTKQDVLKKDIKLSKTVDINDNVKIDYSKYNSIANEFKTSYGISADCNLIISYYIDYISDNNDLNQNRVIKVEIPLSEQMINIQKSPTINNNLVFFGKTTNSKTNKNLFMVSIGFLVVAVLTLLFYFIEFKKRKGKESKYDNFIDKVLKQYDAYITVAKDEADIGDKPVVKIDSFKELLDVRNSIEKPIVYLKVSDNESRFMLIDNEAYIYTITREEMDK